jgi:phosphocarrier protein HPr
MRERTFTLIAPYGLDSREAALLKQAAGRFQSSVIVSKEGDPLEGGAREFMQLMLLAAERGSRLRIRVTGPDEDAALDAISDEFMAQEIMISDDVSVRGQYEIYMDLKKAGRVALEAGRHPHALLLLAAVSRKFPEGEVVG